MYLALCLVLGVLATYGASRSAIRSVGVEKLPIQKIVAGILVFLCLSLVVSFSAQLPSLLRKFTWTSLVGARQWSYFSGR
jgi:hypothetical protein